MKSSLVALCILLSAVFPGFQLLVHNHIQQLKMSELLAVTLSYMTLPCTTRNLTSVRFHSCNVQFTISNTKKPCFWTLRALEPWFFRLRALFPSSVFLRLLALHFLARSLGALNLFGTLKSATCASCCERGSHFIALLRSLFLLSSFLRFLSSVPPWSFCFSMRRDSVSVWHKWSVCFDHFLDLRRRMSIR